MNIVETLKHNGVSFHKGLSVKPDIYELDNSKGETDFTRILLVEKQRFDIFQAIAVLIMRLQMHREDRTDFTAYTKEDIACRITFLERGYKNSTYLQNVDLQQDADYYWIERLNRKADVKAIYLNSEKIDFNTFHKICPVFTDRIINVSKSTFERLEVEFYIETERYFVLFNWYTTA
jgi:hypothetical protein